MKVRVGARLSLLRPLHHLLLHRRRVHRLWHRGLPNTGETDRYLLYTVFQKAETKKQMELTGGSKVALSKGVDGSRAW